MSVGEVINIASWAAFWFVIGRYSPRKKSLHEQFGELMHGRILGVYQQRKWVGLDGGIEISNTTEMRVGDDRTVEIVVREKL